MESPRAEKHLVGKSRISPGALLEIEGALVDYEEEVWQAAHARDGISQATVKTYAGGPKKFVAWIRYAYAPMPPSKGQARAGAGVGALRIERPAATKCRISLSALAEAEAVFEEFMREVLWAKMGQRATNQLGDHAEYFMRWLKYDFAPGSRKGWKAERRKSAVV